MDESLFKGSLGRLQVHPKQGLHSKVGVFLGAFRILNPGIWISKPTKSQGEMAGL